MADSIVLYGSDRLNMKINRFTSLWTKNTKLRGLSKINGQKVLIYLHELYFILKTK